MGDIFLQINEKNLFVVDLMDEYLSILSSTEEIDFFLGKIGNTNTKNLLISAYNGKCNELMANLAKMFFNIYIECLLTFDNQVYNSNCFENSNEYINDLVPVKNTIDFNPWEKVLVHFSFTNSNKSFHEVITFDLDFFDSLFQECNYLNQAMQRLLPEINETITYIDNKMLLLDKYQSKFNESYLIERNNQIVCFFDLLEDLEKRIEFLECDLSALLPNLLTESNKKEIEHLDSNFGVIKGLFLVKISNLYVKLAELPGRLEYNQNEERIEAYEILNEIFLEISKSFNNLRGLGNLMQMNNFFVNDIHDSIL